MMLFGGVAALVAGMGPTPADDGEGKAECKGGGEDAEGEGMHKGERDGDDTGKEDGDSKRLPKGDDEVVGTKEGRRWGDWTWLLDGSASENTATGRTDPSSASKTSAGGRAVEDRLLFPTRLRMTPASIDKEISFREKCRHTALVGVFNAASMCTLALCAADFNAIKLLPWVVYQVPGSCCRKPDAFAEYDAVEYEKLKSTCDSLRERECLRLLLHRPLNMNGFSPDWQHSWAPLRVWAFVWALIEDFAQIAIQLTFLLYKGADGCYPSYAEATGTTVSIIFSVLRVCESIALFAFASPSIRHMRQRLFTRGRKTASSRACHNVRACGNLLRNLRREQVRLARNMNSAVEDDRAEQAGLTSLPSAHGWTSVRQRLALLRQRGRVQPGSKHNGDEALASPPGMEQQEDMPRKGVISTNRQGGRPHAIESQRA
mmetsp:Transcript_4638/g.18578  ORF Transcript_4638/g.18578 Transcript_4638/m.18578 type:complete len:431 (-) Transcript_4638:41-1333(-)